jgi:OPA family glycerol-3-phosphate transporter-like MFS transporter
MPSWLRELSPILILLAVVGLVLWRLPRVDLGHSDAFRRRRFLNWFPLGMTYAFLYFGRYNINEATSALGKLTDNSAFGTIFAVGAWVYGLSFLVNGPLTDRLGGRVTILISAAGVAVANALMGALVVAVVDGGWSPPGGIVLWLCGLYGLNMYFQSFGAVSIVKVNAAWFHVRERGVQGGVFGILISLGIYFGYDWSRMIVRAAPASPYWAFFVPAMVLAAIFVVAWLLIRDSPGEAGYRDFDVGDASSGDTGPRLGVVEVFSRMFRNPVILVIVAIEFCTGFLRNGVMSWYPKFARSTGIADGFVAANWGMLLCVFGIVGGMFAGVISDRLFQSRRGPVASVLYAGITAGAVAMTFALAQPWVGWVLVFMALNYVGVHGMLSGTASADFGGKKNAGVAVGIIDGFVYLGTGLQSLIVGQILPQGDLARDPANWLGWPVAMLPVAVIGLALCARVWNARPQPKSAAPQPGPAPAEPPAPAVQKQVS